MTFDGYCYFVCSKICAAFKGQMSSKLEPLLVITSSLAYWIECSPMAFNPRSSHTKDLKNGTWYLLV